MQYFHCSKSSILKFGNINSGKMYAVEVTNIIYSLYNYHHLPACSTCMQIVKCKLLIVKYF